MDIQIETKRLILREYIESDWTSVHEYAKLGDILTYVVWGPNDDEDTKKFIEKIIESKHIEPRTDFELAIILKTENKLIGGCSFRKDKLNPQKGSLGFIINPSYWECGYASEATNALIEYAIKKCNIYEIEATCDTQNIASQKVLKKCGFIQVSLINNHIKMKGRIRDTYFFSKKLRLHTG